MSFFEKTEQLIKRVHAGTTSDKIPWEETGDENEFQTAFPRYSIAIRRTVDQELIDINQPGPLNPAGAMFTVPKYREVSKDKYVFSIYDDRGKLIDSKAVVGDGYLEDIYEGARRNARNAEKALDDLLMLVPE
jgi:hypothetical protein